MPPTAPTEADAPDVLRVSDLFVQILFKTLSEDVIAELGDHTVSLPQVQAMRFVWLHERVLMGALAAGLNISYPSATNMVKRLERQGLAERHTNPEDRREVEVRLTDRGAKLTERMERERVQRFRAVMEAMPSKDRHELSRSLYSFVSRAVCQGEGVADQICLRCGAHASPNCPIAASNLLPLCR